MAPSLSSGFEMALLRMVSFLPGEINETKKKVKTVIQKTNFTEKVNNSTKDNSSVLNSASLNEEVKEVQKNSHTDVKHLDISLDNWNLVFTSLDLDAGTRQLASHCSFVKADDTVLYLSMPEEKLNLFNGKHRQELQNKLSDYLKKDCNIFLEEGEFSQDSPNQIKAKEKRKIQDEAERAIKDDPKVKKIIEEFGAKVIESTVIPRKSE